MLCADEHLVFYAHAKAMKMFWELWISWDIHAWYTVELSNEKDCTDIYISLPGSIVMTIPSFSLRQSDCFEDG